MQSCAGTCTVVHAHIFLHRQNLGTDPAAYFKPMSPQYFIKLRKAEVVAHVRGGGPIMGSTVGNFEERGGERCPRCRNGADGDSADIMSEPEEEEIAKAKTSALNALATGLSVPCRRWG